MLRLLISLLLPIAVYCAVQCYVGQKLFSYEASNSICAKFIPYHCTTQCEWKKNCSQSTGYGAFRGRRDVQMERDGDSRVDVAIEVCQYQTELEHCDINKMNDAERRRFNLVQLKLQRYNSSSTAQKAEIKSEDDFLSTSRSRSA